MSTRVEITPSELVLSAVFFLQQRNGVSAKDIIKFICKKWDCKQSAVAGEVKEALKKAVESGIFTKKQGLYKMESSLGNDLKLMKKRMENSSNESEDQGSELREQLEDSCKCLENMDDQWLKSGSSKSERISLDQLDLLRSKVEDDDDDDDEEDFLEDEDDEMDFFDDQAPQSYTLKTECTPPVKKSCEGHKHRRRNKRKSSNKSKKRKCSKPPRRAMKRKKLICSCKNTDSCENGVVKNREDDMDCDTPGKNDKSDECNNSEENRRGNNVKKSKDAAEGSEDEYCNEDCNCNLAQDGKDCQSEEPKDGSNTVRSKEDVKNPKDEGKDGKKTEDTEADKNGDDATAKEGKDLVATNPVKTNAPPSPVKTNATPNQVPPEREWRRKKTKRERSSSLFRPIKKKVSSKDKSVVEQKAAKNKNSK